MVGNNPQGNVFDQSAAAYSSGVGSQQAALNPMAVPMTMNQYINPYQDMVINDTLDRMRNERDIALNNVRAQAAQSRAYGGARQGLVEAELYGQSQRNMGEAAAQMSQQGFNTAAQLGQNRLNQMLSGGANLVGSAQTGFNMGQANLRQQQQAGMQQQMLMQQILSQGNQQYQNYANYPQQALATALAGVQGNPLAGATTQTSSFNPGLFNYMQAAGGIYAAGK